MRPPVTRSQRAIVQRTACTSCWPRSLLPLVVRMPMLPAEIEVQRPRRHHQRSRRRDARACARDGKAWPRGRRAGGRCGQRPVSERAFGVAEGSDGGGPRSCPGRVPDVGPYPDIGEYPDVGGCNQLFLLHNFNTSNQRTSQRQVCRFWFQLAPNDQHERERLSASHRSVERRSRSDTETSRVVKQPKATLLGHMLAAQQPSGKQNSDAKPKEPSPAVRPIVQLLLIR
mmetsp:Transcript_57589/g.187106  ORF Transcript_57589/g.187106 Transcript_57589/m.187106 type:complete len:228 (-) Transcript_57589:640-1323(-)